MEDIVKDEFQDTDSTICCRLCEYQAKIITPGHLKKHSTTMIEYRQKFPDAPLVCKDTAKKLSHNAKEQSEKARKEKTKLILDEIEKSPKIETLPEIQIKEDNIVKKIDNLIISNTIDTEGISKSKAQILIFLQRTFSSDKVVNNYFVEKFIIDRYLEYRIVTDIAIPSLKIDFEFPNSFWHNEDVRRTKDLRDVVLRRDGWKVIDIESRNPNCEDVKIALESLVKIKIATS